MSIRSLLVWGLAFAGCEPTTTPVALTTAPAPPAPEPPRPEPPSSAMPDAALPPGAVGVDARGCTILGAHAALGLGSQGIREARVEGGECVYAFVSEVEGGGTEQVCRVPRSAGRVVIPAAGHVPGRPVGDCTIARRFGLHDAPGAPSR
jgi:hypothetical protein